MFLIQISALPFGLFSVLTSWAKISQSNMNRKVSQLTELQEKTKPVLAEKGQEWIFLMLTITTRSQIVEQKPPRAQGICDSNNFVEMLGIYLVEKTKLLMCQYNKGLLSLFWSLVLISPKQFNSSGTNKMFYNCA